jgi:Family of unknown function (DUF6544)
MLRTLPSLVLGVALLTLAVAGVVASLNSFRFARRVAREAEDMWAGAGAPRPVDRRRIDGLPAPVRAYLGKALGGRVQGVRTVRFRHGGRFRTKLDGPWRPIRGEQYESAAPPGFLWWGRLRAAPGFWVDARDRSVNGVGGMLVSIASSVTIADRAGPEMDQGSLLRLLSDLVLFPTALLDERYVTWSGVDEAHARATLHLNGREVTGVFAFGEDGLPHRFSAERYFDTGRGRAELRSWSGDYGDYREAEAMLVPHHFVGYWHVDGKRIPYVDFQLERPEYDVTVPF